MMFLLFIFPRAIGNLDKTNSCKGIQYNATLSTAVEDGDTINKGMNNIAPHDIHFQNEDSSFDNLNLLINIKNKIAGTAFIAIRMLAPED